MEVNQSVGRIYALLDRIPRLHSLNPGGYHGGRVTLQCSCYGSLGIAARVGIALSPKRGWVHSNHFALCFLFLPVGGEKAVYNFFRSPMWGARKSSNNAQKSSEDTRTILPLTIAAAPR
jgi:hypothetical protein